MLYEVITIFENHSLFGSGLKYMLSETREFQISTESNSINDLITGIKITFPDILLFDVLHCDNGGIRLLRKT